VRSARLTADLRGAVVTHRDLEVRSDPPPFGAGSASASSAGIATQNGAFGRAELCWCCVEAAVQVWRCNLEH
jgi:hypothetical protein